MTTPLSMSTAMLVGAAIAAGAVVPFQAAANAALGRAVGHPLWATVVSLIISLIAIAPVLLALRAPAPQLGAATSLPLWAWVGGIAGVIYITAALLLSPRMGTTSFMACVIGGQLLTSLIIDHFGLMGMPTKQVTLYRILGVAMIFIGVLLIQLSSESVIKE
ncbi:DMT family transporter [Pseudomonas sp. K1(2024)]|uniref:DMT family transporter n=2 Tax=Pseudomonas TaxID=286 RepID=A0AAI8K9A0_9PSED|nr:MULTISPECIES: DMT family transporter [Pseudomonas]AIZ32107.1 membrane protein [Pseudomonas parafulva]AXO87596.1 DMT family transporter [Pseudomonas parafulva]MDO7903267.1 DMT family transporter [Pseudomonas sp. K13]